jgi:ketosteroid isomerase-like protein
MTDNAALVQRYLAAWNATDPAARREAIAAAFTPDARYVDPMADVRGHDGVDALIAGAQEQFAGLEFSPGEVLDAHHDVVRFTWHLGPAGNKDGEPVVIGFDVAEVAEDGRLERVHGFLDRVPG